MSDGISETGTTDLGSMPEGGEMSLEALAASMGEGDLYSQVVNGEPQGPNLSGDVGSVELDDDINQHRDENTVPNNEADGETEKAEGDSEAKDEEVKPWEVGNKEPEVFQSDEFQSFLEASGKTKDEFVNEILTGVTHKMKVRGQEREVSYDKLIAEAQIAGASRQKSQQMNTHIKNGMLIDAIAKGGDEGMLALKQVLAGAKDSLGKGDVEGLIDTVLDLEGNYDDSKDLQRAEEVSEFNLHMGDLLDKPSYDDNMNTIRDDVESWLPKEIGENISSNYESLREYYNIVDSPGYPVVRRMVDERLDALPEATAAQIRANAADFMGLFDYMSQQYAQSLEPNQQQGQQGGSENNQQSQQPGISKTVSPPRTRPGKRATNKQVNADNQDFLSMSRQDLNAMLANYS